MRHWSPAAIVCLIFASSLSLMMLVIVIAGIWDREQWGKEDTEAVVALSTAILAIISLWIGSQIRRRDEDPPADS